MENTFKPAVTYFTIYPPIEVANTELDLSVEYRKEIVNEVKKLSKPNNYLEGLKGSIVNDSSGLTVITPVIVEVAQAPTKGPPGLFIVVIVYV